MPLLVHPIDTLRLVPTLCSLHRESARGFGLDTRQRKLLLQQDAGALRTRRHVASAHECFELAIEIGEEIVTRMDEVGINQAELAQRMGVSRARVSQVLAGSDNLTLRTLVSVANALDSRISLRMECRDVRVATG